MLTAEQNEQLTRVGPGTPMGALMRRYWHPVAAAAELDACPIKRITLLGESLVLYRDRRGVFGLLAEACPHRGASLACGMVEQEGLRCMYHGRLYDAQGSCIDQPSEPARTPCPDDIHATAYPVQMLGGLVFAYVGPEPAPLLPRYNVLVWSDAVGETNGTLISCNWLQVMENLLDPFHVECLHGAYFADVLRRKGGDQLQDFLTNHAPRPMKRIAFDLFKNGIIERHAVKTEEEESWKTGTPSFFPTTSLLGSPGRFGSVIFIVPLDDTHTWFLLRVAERIGASLPPDYPVPFFDVPGTNENGQFIRDTANGQDHMAVVTQGDIAAREVEHIATSDIGIVLYRQLLMEQLARVGHGDDPINVCRDPVDDQVIELPVARRRARAHAVQVIH